MQLASTTAAVPLPSPPPLVPPLPARGASADARRRAPRRAPAPIEVVAEPGRPPGTHPVGDGTLRAGRTPHDLAAWQGAMELAVACHHLTRDLPADAADVGRTVRRAAADVAANVAQGHDRLVPADFVHHLAIARGALSRLATHVEIARRLRFVDDAAALGVERQSGEVARRIGRLVRALYGIGGDRPAADGRPAGG